MHAHAGAVILQIGGQKSAGLQGTERSEKHQKRDHNTQYGKIFEQMQDSLFFGRLSCFSAAQQADKLRQADDRCENVRHLGKVCKTDRPVQHADRRVADVQEYPDFE